MQAELFRKDRYGVAKCVRCGAVGTIVEMGACCRVLARLLQNSPRFQLESAGGLKTNDFDERTKERR